MRSTPRGRGATRVVVVAALLTLLGFVTGFLLVDTAEAEAGEPDPSPVQLALAAESGSLPRLLDVTTLGASMTARAAAATESIAAAATPPPPPPVYCPVPGSQFVDSWGFARSGGRRHKGVDMMAGYGDPVYAPVAGVVRPSNSALGGIGFYLDDADGNELFGSHLASLDVTGPVEAGQQIGTVGTSGNAGTPHLHFEVKPEGRSSVNPFPYAFNWCRSDFSDPSATPLLP